MLCDWCGEDVPLDQITDRQGEQVCVFCRENPDAVPPEVLAEDPHVPGTMPEPPRGEFERMTGRRGRPAERFALQEHRREGGRV